MPVVVACPLDVSPWKSSDAAEDGGSARADRMSFQASTVPCSAVARSKEISAV